MVGTAGLTILRACGCFYGRLLLQACYTCVRNVWVEPMVLKFLYICVVFATALTLGCSKSKASKSSAQGLSGTDEQIFIGDTVEKNYDPNVIMKRAEAFFDKEDYPEAIIEYQHFLDLHRVHVLASYAQYKLAESHFKQARTIDRDIEPVHKALEAFEKLRRDYPGNRYEGDALERIQSCHRFIAESYMFVGNFYYRREAFLAAAHRYEAVLTRYPDMDLAADALYHLAQTYKELGADDWAVEKLAAFTERYPQHKFAATGRSMLAQLKAKAPSQALAQANTPAPNPPPDIPASIPPAIHAGAIPPTAPTSALAPGPLAARTDRPNQSPVTTTLCRLGSWC